ncbi:MAG: hypothetical protein QOD64_323 [Verrucomicrobiota bacterium]
MADDMAQGRIRLGMLTKGGKNPGGNISIAGDTRIVTKEAARTYRGRSFAFAQDDRLLDL